MSGSVTVSVRQGALRGRRRKTPAGNAFVSFQNIPYAKPPLGALRFQAPQPADSWTGIRDATKEGSQCPQFEARSKQVIGDENCLVLNVFTPRLPLANGKETPQAVLAWIHGGGFMGGSSNMYDAEPYMDYGVVVVTINYRVGPLGFLGLGTVDAPGNAGLKDQTMALRWVKENIAAFGGDPENVTIFGESAGGASVHYQVISSLTKGLFRRAIAQSGTALCPWAISRDPVGRAQRLAVAAGCDSAVADDPTALLRWLRQVPAQQLLAAVDAARTAEERRRALVFTFVPCVEPPHPGAFISDDPAALLANGDVNRVPLMLGITSHEGILAVPGTMLRLGLMPMPVAEGGAPASPEAAAAALEAAEAKAMAEVAADLERMLPEDLLVGPKNLQRSRELVERLKDFYLDGKQLTNDTLQGFVDMNTDVHFGLGAMRAARGHARLGSPVYVYQFAFEGRLNTMTSMLPGNKARGVCHGDEMTYLFNLVRPGITVPMPEEGSAEEMARRRLLRLWTDFSKSGNPTPKLDEVITATWLPYSESAPNYLQIEENLKADTGLLKERVKFWEDLYRK